MRRSMSLRARTDGGIPFGSAEGGGGGSGDGRVSTTGSVIGSGGGTGSGSVGGATVGSGIAGVVDCGGSG